MSNHRSVLTGKDGFMVYYRTIAEVFGKDPELLFEMLSYPTKPILRFFERDRERLKNLWEKSYTFNTLSWYPQALTWPDNTPMETDLPGHKKHLHYAMNPSSLLPVLALTLSKDDVVLDACAAPGGKALAIAEIVLKGEGHLVANELSKPRLNRMRKVFDDFGVLRYIELSQVPAETLYKDSGPVFDAVLLDAPCSSEKHIYADETRLSLWSTKRIKKLRQRQYRMIDTVLRTLKLGGRLVYATCAITPEENEAVVGKILKNRGDVLELQPMDWGELPGEAGIPGSYDTEFNLSYVRRIWPDKTFDPMFVSMFKRIN